MYKIIIALLTVLIFSVAGCSSYGNQDLKKENQATLQTKLIKNKTTKNDVIKEFGQPSSTTTSGQGEDIYLYDMNNAKMSVINVIPIIGMLAGNTKTESRTLSIAFNKNGTVETWSFMSDDRNLNNGFIN
jgi:outer membrane protein assembly factor BamE (lipoprotein component of BamABCDE complex)